MTDIIRNELRALERRENITILLAVESGSRAWGFASPDSDWDVRYIYIHPVDWYLRIDDGKDSQEAFLPNDIDLAGWELRKALRLLRKSNPSLLEWLRSPIIYLEQGTTAARMRELSQLVFDQAAGMHHYLRMATGKFDEHLQQEQVRLKKYFYVLRPILACDWILQRQTTPPMEFAELLRAQTLDATVLRAIEELLALKGITHELGMAARNPILHSFIEERLAFHTEYVRTQLPHRPFHDHTTALNALFMETLEDRKNVEERTHLER